MWNGPYSIAIAFSHKLHGQSMYTVMNCYEDWSFNSIIYGDWGFMSFILVFFQKKGVILIDHS